ncbi:hypothetical protein H696_04998 [Fonticula alba]|uniref:Glycosyltransferase 2-like domain-containing protein n=1 Tax=Fonticula alba TaxID=691883 RepID=A0A058Z369_FONAL|nr:hypothetical protein H696_04998 [Fonticula alba]KCV68710.1 hypothetical protein H696_04998 [Fonticula alba]|eukprot:XP_009497142.1 hypothetical protein H696_04998 [Fonticula alba]
MFLRGLALCPLLGLVWLACRNRLPEWEPPATTAPLVAEPSPAGPTPGTYARPLGLCTVIRNEAANIDDWIRHSLEVLQAGLAPDTPAIVLLDDHSSDDIERVLGLWEAQAPGLLRRLPLTSEAALLGAVRPEEQAALRPLLRPLLEGCPPVEDARPAEGRACQVAAQDFCLEASRTVWRWQWVGLIDVDEFIVFDQETPRASLWGLLEGIVDRAMGASSAPDLAVALAWKSAGGAGWLDRQTHGLSRFTARHADPWELDARARRVRASSHADSSRLGELGYHPQVAGELFKLKSFVRWAGAGAGAGTAIHAGRCGGHILKGPTILTDGQPLRSCGDPEHCLIEGCGVRAPMALDAGPGTSLRLVHLRTRSLADFEEKSLRPVVQGFAGRKARHLAATARLLHPSSEGPPRNVTPDEVPQVSFDIWRLLGSGPVVDLQLLAMGMAVANTGHTPGRVTVVGGDPLARFVAQWLLHHSGWPMPGAQEAIHKHRQACRMEAFAGLCSPLRYPSSVWPAGPETLLPCPSEASLQAWLQEEGHDVVLVHPFSRSTLKHSMALGSLEHTHRLSGRPLDALAHLAWGRCTLDWLGRVADRRLVWWDIEPLVQGLRRDDAPASRARMVLQAVRHLSSQLGPSHHLHLHIDAQVAGDILRQTLLQAPQLEEGILAERSPFVADAMHLAEAIFAMLDELTDG